MLFLSLRKNKCFDTANVTGQLKVKTKKKWPRKESEWLEQPCRHHWYSPCAPSTMSDAGFFIYSMFSKPLSRHLHCRIRVQPHTIAPSRMRTISVSWCQLCRNLGAVILFAVSCQPVIILLTEIYPWSSSCCTLLERVFIGNCSASGHQSTGGVVTRPFASLTWSRRVFFINSATLAFIVMLADIVTITTHTIIASLAITYWIVFFLQILWLLPLPLCL